MAKSSSFYGLEVQRSQCHFRSGTGKCVRFDHFLHLCTSFAIGRDVWTDDFNFQHPLLFCLVYVLYFFTKLTLLKWLSYSGILKMWVLATSITEIQWLFAFWHRYCNLLTWGYQGYWSVETGALPSISCSPFLWAPQREVLHDLLPYVYFENNVWSLLLPQGSFWFLCHPARSSR